ncbi:MAG: calcium-binding protein, partial [Amphritea sp.]|nr:calcium-binding protein [Amphritea sp.]
DNYNPQTLQSAVDRAYAPLVSAIEALIVAGDTTVTGNDRSLVDSYYYDKNLGISHSDLQDALVRAHKELDIGALDRLMGATGQPTDVTVNVSIDRVVPDSTDPDGLFNRTLESVLTSVSTQHTAITGIVWDSTSGTTLAADRSAWFVSVLDFANRGLELIGQLPLGATVPDEAKFSLTALNAFINSTELADLKALNGTRFDALSTALDNLLSYITLDIVNTDNKTKNLDVIAESGLQVYLSTDLGTVAGGVTTLKTYTAERSYLDDLWAQADVDLGNLYNSRLDLGALASMLDENGNPVGTRADIGSSAIGFLDRLVALPDEDGNDSEALGLTTTGNADPALAKIVTYLLPGADNLHVGEGDDATSGLATNKVEMLKEYVQQLNSLNGAYYTQSYYSVDGSGNKILSAVAINRVNGLVAGAEALENGVYLTADTWNDYVTAVGQSGRADQDFEDGYVKALIEAAFGQAQRTDITAPVEDGTRVHLDSNGRIGYFDIQTVQDDDFFYLPSLIQIREDFSQSVTVTAAENYATNKANPYEVTYDTLTLSEAGNDLNYGFFMNSFENVELNLNTDSGEVADVNVGTTRYVEDLTITTGSGADDLDIITDSALNTLTINTHAGADKVDVGASGTASLTLTTEGGADEVTLSQLAGNINVETGDDSDIITIFDDLAGTGAVVEIDGGDQGDKYIFTVTQGIVGGSLINLKDGGNDGDDTLLYKGSSDPDNGDLVQLDVINARTLASFGAFGSKLGNEGEGLLISHFDDVAGDFVAATLDDTDALMAVEQSELSNSANYQILNYSTIEQVTVHLGAGNDKVVSDDTSQEIDIFGGDGDDEFYIGSIVEAGEVSVEGRLIDIALEVTNGTSFEMNIYGGDDDDYFEVNHNKADIGLYGDKGNDTFFIKALLTLNEDEDLVEIDNKIATLSGTSGEGSEADQKGNNDTRQVDVDSLVYVENANIKIDGGAGFDSVAIVGTALSDTFYIFTEVDPDTNETVQRIYGAGVKLRELLNIESIQVITGAGDDRVYVYGVNMGAVANLIINTGSGSDTIYFGGDTLEFDLNYPTRKRTDYASVDGYDSAGTASVAYGLDIELTESLERVVPFEVVVPAHTLKKVVAAAPTLAGILNPVEIKDSEGWLDTVVFNNQEGATNLTFEARDLIRKEIDTDVAQINFPTTATNTVGETDLIAELNTLSTSAQDGIKEMVNDHLHNQITFDDRYTDTDADAATGLGLISRLAAKAAAGTGSEPVTIVAGVSYAVFQNTLTDQNTIDLARQQLFDFLVGTGFTVNYDITNPSGTDPLYKIRDITRGSETLAFEGQYTETLKDGVTYYDLIGVSLITATAIDLELQAGYLKPVDITDPQNIKYWNEIRRDELNSVFMSDEKPRIYFETPEEIKLNLNETQASTLTLNNDRFTGKLFVQGGGENDNFNVNAIAGQTFLHGGEGDDTFTVGQGTVDQINSELFMLGEGGDGDSVIVNSTDLTGTTDVEFVKNTVQHQLQQEKLSKVTNALELTVDDTTTEGAAENALIGAELETESVAYAEEAALKVDAADLQAIAVQAANELGVSLEEALTATKNLYMQQIGLVDQVDGLIQDQQSILRSYLESTLAKYYSARQAVASKETTVARLEASIERQADSAVQSIFSQWSLWNSQIQAPTSSWMTANHPGWSTWYLYFSVGNPQDFNANTVLSGYDKTANTLTLAMKMRIYGDGITTGYKIGDGGWNALDQILPTATSYVIPVNPYIAGKLANIESLKAQSLVANKQLETLRAELKGATAPLKSYFTNAAGTATSSLSQAELDAFFIAVKQRGITEATNDVIGNNAGVVSALNTIKQEITDTSDATLTALIDAIADAHALAIATGDIATKVDAVTTELTSLRAVLSATPGTADSWDKWVYLVRSQLEVDVKFTPETTELGSIKTLWQAIPNVAGYNAATTFNGLTAPTWQDSLDLFDDTNFANVVSAYKLAQELAKDFTNYSDVEYTDYRAAYRNMLKFETATTYLENGFNFEDFKSDYKTNVDKLDTVIELLESIRLESQYKAQLVSLRADKQEIDAIVNHNAAIVSFFQDRLNEANAAKATLLLPGSELLNDYTVTFSYFLGLSYTYTFDYSHDARYVAANNAISEAQTNLSKAQRDDNQALSDQAGLNAKIAAIDSELTDVQATLTASNVDLDALKQTLDQQYKFLRNLSRVAITVLSETRANAAQDFEDTSSLVAEVLSYASTYTVTSADGTPAGADPDSPYASAVFTPGPSGNSVVATKIEWDSFEVLSLNNLNVGGIHADYNTIENFTLNLGGSLDTVSIKDSLGQAISEVTVNTGEGKDDITVGKSQNLNGIVGTVTVDVGTDASDNTLTIDDSEDLTNNKITMTNSNRAGYTSVTETNQGDINYRGNYSQVDGSAGVNLKAGKGNDDITIAGVIADAHTLVEANEGDDDVTVTNTNTRVLNSPTSLTIKGDLGDDVIDASKSGFGVTIEGNQGDDVIFGSAYDDNLSGNEDNDLIVGGLGADTISGDEGQDLLLGDLASITLELPTNPAPVGVPLPLPQGQVVSVIVTNDNVSELLAGIEYRYQYFRDGVITRLESTLAGGNAGNGDTMTGGTGNDTLIGGAGQDIISDSSGNELVFGDHALITYLAGITLAVASRHSNEGDDDIITLLDGNNTVLGGSGGDTINTANGTDLVLGDNGEIQYTGSELSSISSTNTADGGIDDINLGNGSKTVIAGVGADTVDTGTSGIHRVIGDNGTITYNAGALRSMTSDAHADGGEDTITLSGDVNQVIGGSAADGITVSTATSTDHVLGDNGTMTYTGVKGSEQLTNMQSDLGETGGDDTITLGSGDKIVIAGKGKDTVTTTLNSAGSRVV